MKLARNALLVTFAIASFTAGITATAFAADKGKAEAKLKTALGAQDAEKVREACDELIEVGGKDALNVILNMIASPQVADQLYWQLVGAASGFHDEPALGELAKQIVAHQNDKGARGSLSRDLLFGLQNNNAPERAKAVGSILKTGNYDLQLLAVDQLAQLRAVESVDALVECYKKEGTKGDPELRHRLINALKALTDQTFQDPADWSKYWDSQRSQGVPAPKAAGGGGSGGTMEKPRDKEFGGSVEKMPPKHVIVLANVGDAKGDEKPEQDDIDYDTMQTVLTQYKIPHIVVKRKTFEAGPQSFLKDAYAVLINCHQINEHCVCPNCKPPEGDLQNRMMHCNHKCNVHQQVTYGLKQATLEALKDWVENQGGFLYTEDWGLVETVQKLWPDKVECGSTGSGEKKTLKLIRKQKEDKSGWYPHIPCKLVPARGNTSHPLMRGVWEKPKKAEEPKKADPAEAGGTRARENSPAKPLEHMWTVDDESPAIDIKDPNSVIALLEAPDLVKIGDGFSQVVAVTFRTGKAKPQPKKQATGPDSDEGKVKGTGEWAANSAGGRVLHTMSHYGHQGGGTDDGQCLFNLIVNFLLEAAKRHDGSDDGK